MIKTTIIAEIDGQHFEFNADLPGVAAWASTPGETATGLLFEGVEQLSRALNAAPPLSPATLATMMRPAPPEPATDEYGDSAPCTSTRDGVRCSLVWGHESKWHESTDGNGHTHSWRLGDEARAPVPTPPTVLDDYGNRVCYMCGFYHDDSGSCTNPDASLSNLNAGPDDGE
jgi:hypothetical protein